MKVNTWSVYEATSLAELEKYLNEAENKAFELKHLFLLPGIEPNFVLVCRRHVKAAATRSTDLEAGIPAEVQS